MLLLRVAAIRVMVINRNQDGRDDDDAQSHAGLVLHEHGHRIKFGHGRHEERAAVRGAVIQAEQRQDGCARDGTDAQGHQDGKDRGQHEDGEAGLTRQDQFQRHANEIKGAEDQVFVADPAKMGRGQIGQFIGCFDMLHIRSISRDDHNQGADAGNAGLESLRNEAERIEQ
jgi:hypothetical protein